MKIVRVLVYLFMQGIILILPSVNFAANVFRIDMDANTPGLQKEIWVNPGERFTVNIELALDSNADALSSFGYSLWWDAGELYTPEDRDVITNSFDEKWIDMSYFEITPSGIYNLSQINLSDDPGTYLSSTVASIQMNAALPENDGFDDITVGFYSGLDMAFNKNFNRVEPVFEGGRVNIVPEPEGISLFIYGAAALVINRLFVKKAIQKINRIAD